MTEIEQQIKEKLEAGIKRKEIAKELGISNTVYDRLRKNIVVIVKCKKCGKDFEKQHNCLYCENCGRQQPAGNKKRFRVDGGAANPIYAKLRKLEIGQKVKIKETYSSTSYGDVTEKVKQNAVLINGGTVKEIYSHGVVIENEKGVKAFISNIERKIRRVKVVPT